MPLHGRSAILLSDKCLIDHNEHGAMGFGDQQRNWLAVLERLRPDEERRVVQYCRFAPGGRRTTDPRL
jgi:hypothetical protein